MFEFAKKGWYIGLGLASMTREKAEAFAKDFAQRAKLSEEEGRRFADYLQDESRKARENLRENVESLVHSTMRRMPYRSRIETLEKRVAALEAAAGIEPPAPEPEPTPEETADTEAPAEAGADAAARAAGTESDTPGGESESKS